MPPAARWAMRSIASSSAPSTSAGCGAACRDLLRERAKVKRCRRERTAGRMPGRVGRAEDEETWRGLLERLEEDVPALLDALDLVDDEDLAFRSAGGVATLGSSSRMSSTLLLTRRPLDDVERTSLADGDAGRARVVGSPSTGWAVDRLGDDPRGARFACSTRPDEEQAVRGPGRGGRHCAKSATQRPGQ